MAAAAVMDERMRVALDLGLRELDPAWREFIAEHPNARDADGDYIQVCLGANEPAAEIGRALAGYRHPVFVATSFDGNTGVAQLDVNAEPAVGARVVNLPATATVADVFKLLRENQGVSLAVHIEDASAVLVGSL